MFISLHHEVIIEEKSEVFSWDTANERTLFRKNLNIKQDELCEGVSQWQNSCILSNLTMGWVV